MRAIALIIGITGCTGPHVHDAYTPEPFITRAMAEAERGLLFHGVREARLRPSHDKSLAIAWILLQAGPTPPLIEFKPSAMAEAETFGHAAVVWVLGHELGHQILFDEGLRSKGPPTELAADTWGGCALAELGLDPKPALQYIDETCLESSTHPGPAARIEATLTGYEMCTWR